MITKLNRVKNWSNGYGLNLVVAEKCIRFLHQKILIVIAKKLSKLQNLLNT